MWDNYYYIVFSWRIKKLRIWLFHRIIRIPLIIKGGMANVHIPKTMSHQSLSQSQHGHAKLKIVHHKIKFVMDTNMFCLLRH